MSMTEMKSIKEALAKIFSDIENHHGQDRRSFLGGSDCAAILGVSKWATPLDVYFKKTNQCTEIVDQIKSSIFRRGHRLEAYVLSLAQIEYNFEAISVNKRYFHKDYGFLSSEIDFEWIDENGDIQNGEIKTASDFAAAEWADGVPIYYQAQAHHNMIITGRTCCMLIVQIGLEKIEKFLIHADKQLHQHILDTEIKFWETNILAGVPPEPTNHEDVDRLYPFDNQKEIEATHEVKMALHRIKNYVETKKELEALIENDQMLIKNHMKNCTALVNDGLTLATWKTQESKRIDVKRLALEKPDIKEKYEVEQRSRPFKIK